MIMKHSPAESTVRDVRCSFCLVAEAPIVCVYADTNETYCALCARMDNIPLRTDTKVIGWRHRSELFDLVYMSGYSPDFSRHRPIYGW
jgi:hypothetical protein